MNRAIQHLGGLLAVAAALALAACGDGAAREYSGAPEGPMLQTPLSASRPLAGPAGRVWRAEVEPFSPTLGRIFANGRIIVIPDYASAAGMEASLASNYAFSAMDGFGRIYHFTRSLKWTMAETRPLPRELPQMEWRAAWNNRARALELLVTAPEAGESSVTLCRMESDRWEPVATSDAPPRAAGTLTAFDAVLNVWFLIAAEAGPGQGLYRLDGERWERLASAGAPDFSPARWLISYPPAPGLALLMDSGEIWLWAQNAWSRELALPPDDYAIFHFNPSSRRILAGVSRGIGRTTLQSIGLARGAAEAVFVPRAATRSDLVRVNEETEGAWGGLGRVAEDAGGGRGGFTRGLDGAGRPAMMLETRAGGSFWTEDEIDTIEFSPQFASILPDRGESAPALGGHIEISAMPSGIRTSARKPFPFVEVEDALTSDVLALAPHSTLRERHSRFWLFEGDAIEWLKPYPEVHPDLDYPVLRASADGRAMEMLDWRYPEDGTIEYRYRLKNADKEQWMDSPTLNLRSLPQAAWEEGDIFWMLDPVPSGSPAEVVAAGWVGRAERAPAEEGKPGEEAYSAVPSRGFLARIAALSPEAWSSQPLPIDFTPGARLIPHPARPELFLLGGRTAVPERGKGGTRYVLRPNAEVWHWQAGGWTKLDAGRMPELSGAPAPAMYDAAREELLALHGFDMFGLGREGWRSLARWSGGGEGAVPGAAALAQHPATGRALASWSGPPRALALWDEGRWARVEGLADGGATTGSLASGEARRFWPLAERDAFAELDPGDLAAARDLNFIETRAKRIPSFAYRYEFSPLGAGGK